MTNPFPVFGDIEAACIDILMNDPYVQSFPIDKIASDLTDYTSGKTWVYCRRQGGNVKSFVIDKPRVDFDIYGVLRSATHDLAQAVQAAILNSGRGNYHGHGVLVSDARVETGIVRGDDNLNDAPRYILAIRFAVTAG